VSPLAGSTDVGLPTDGEFHVPASGADVVKGMPDQRSLVQDVVNALNGRLSRLKMHFSRRSNHHELRPERSSYQCTWKSPHEVSPCRFALQNSCGSADHYGYHAGGQRACEPMRVHDCSRSPLRMLHTFKDTGHSRRASLGEVETESPLKAGSLHRNRSRRPYTVNPCPRRSPATPGVGAATFRPTWVVVL